MRTMIVCCLLRCAYVMSETMLICCSIPVLFEYVVAIRSTEYFISAGVGCWSSVVVIVVRISSSCSISLSV